MRCKFILLCAAMTAGAAAGAERREIQIIRADVARNYRSGGLNISRLIGDVALLHNNTLMTCDSAYLYPDQRFEAFGSVAIHKDTTSLYGNYMDYRSAENLCKIRGKIVTLIDGQTRLRTQQIDFNTAHNSARFWDGGVIDNGDNLLESQQGTYYSKQKLAIFYQEVEMKNPDYLIRSDSLHYYTEREKAEFWGQTYLWGDSIFMASRYGYYDRPADLVFLAQRAYAQTAKQEAWSDSIQYYRRIRTGYFYGNIQVADTVQRAVLFGDYAKLTDNPQTALVTKQPSAALYGEKPSDDTMFVRADTFLSYNIPRSTMLQRARPDTLSAPEAPADAPAPEPPPLPVSYCETWHLPCSDNYALPYRYDRRERFAENTDYQRLHRRRDIAFNVPYLPPLRASPDFAEQTAALLLADSVFALQMLDTLRQSPLFARYVGGLPLVDSLGKTASALAAHLDALQTLHHRDSLALADLQTLRTAEMQEMSALRSQRTEDSAAIADLQAAQNAHQQTISRLLVQRRADSAQTAALLAQQSRSEAFIHSLQYFRRRDSALIAGLRRRLAGDTTPAPPETPPIERLAAIYGLTFRSKTDSSTGLAYSPLDLPADSAPPDTAAQDTMVRHFIAYRNVRFFHKDMQGKCDSFIYIVSDSMGEMHRLPVVWSDNNQKQPDTSGRTCGICLCGCRRRHHT